MTHPLCFLVFCFKNIGLVIAYLNGTLAYKSPAYVYIDCNGIGYHVNISLNTYSKLEPLAKAKVYTYLHVTETAQSLYGFADQEEREVFTLLISVSGVGPNTGRVILSYMTTDEVKSAIVHDNVVALNKVKGIGPKTAKRIILDLKDKMIKVAGDQPMISGGVDNTVQNEALSALVALGFPKASVEKHIKAILSSQPLLESVEELIKLVLKKMR